MKKKLFYIIISILIFTAGCRDFLDVNHDPNNPSESTVELVLPAGIQSTASVFGGSWLALGNIWSQYWTSAPNAPQFQAEDSYGITAGDYYYDLNGWETLYTGPLMDFEWVKNETRETGNWKYYVIAVAMQCYTYQVMADFFEDIPLTEALLKLPAHYDDGQVVYDTLMARLDEALLHTADDFDLETSVAPGDEDLIFSGNMDNWIAFINTLKLKMYLRQFYARPTVAETGIRAMFDNNVQFLGTDAVFTAFTDEEGRDNYMYAFEFRGGNNNLKASKTLLDLLDDEGDPRLNYIYDAPESGTHVGVYQGDYRNVYSDAPTLDEDISAPIVTPITPTYYFSKAEVYFLIAEACMRFNLTYNGNNDEAMYKLGIDADFQKLSVDDFTGDFIYGSAGWAPYPTTGTPEEKLEAIIVQKWIAMANIQGVEAFFEHNRTGYPKESTIKPGDEGYPADLIPGEFTVSVTSVLAPPVLFPKRFLFPSSEQSRNPYVPAVINLNVPVWWDRSNF